MPSSILINELIVVGIRKNYTVKFNPGVNIIYGDSTTGKSSILDLIDYLFGAKSFELYPEITAAARYAVMDVFLNETRYTIKRDIFDANRPIEVYPCAFREIENFAAKKYLPSFRSTNQNSELEYYSDFVLSALNLTNIKIKQAPSKDESELVRLSFRDIMHFCYLDQDRLGNKNYFSSENYAQKIKNKEIFKYLFNALDSQIAEIDQAISEKSNLKNRLENKFKVVSEFLRESEFGSLPSLDDEVENTDKSIELLKIQISGINKRITADNEVYRAIKSSLYEIELNKKSITKKLSESESKIEKFTRLHNDYLSDIAKFKSSMEARNLIGGISEDMAICPVCDGDLKLESARNNFEIASNDKIMQEIGSLKRRLKDTQQLINESKAKWESEKLSLKSIEQKENRARDFLDQNTKELVSPYLSERDMYVGQLGELNQKRIELISRLKIRNQHNVLIEQIKSLELNVSQLKESLLELKKNSPSMSNVLANLADHLHRYLSFVKIKDPVGISYTSNNFTPVLRDIEYEGIRSGGLRTILNIGYFCSLLEESLRANMSYPSFLMIDTVGKYLGKTKTKNSAAQDTSADEDLKEGVSDPQKYQNIFEYIIKLSEEFADKNRVCQFILVDNDVPDHIVDQLTGFIVAHFSSERINGLPVGFIDDAKS